MMIVWIVGEWMFTAFGRLINANDTLFLLLQLKLSRQNHVWMDFSSNNTFVLMA